MPKNTTTPPDNLGERVRQRNERAAHFGVNKPYWQQKWSKFHLGVANFIDSIYTLKGGSVVAGMTGAVTGFMEGAFYTGLAFMAVAFLGFASGTGIIAGAVAGGVVYGGIQAVRFGAEAWSDMRSKDGAQLADDFARKHHVIANGIDKNQAKAITEVHKETHKNITPNITPEELEEIEKLQKARRKALEKMRKESKNDEKETTPQEERSR